MQKHYCHEVVTTFNRGLSDERKVYTGQIAVFNSELDARNSAQGEKVFTLTDAELDAFDDYA